MRHATYDARMSRREVRAGVDGGGELAGWVDGSGTPVLLLHGGPGLSFDYLDEVATDIGDGFEIAAYQQRGLSPSTAAAPYDVTTQVGDVAKVLDAIGWDKAVVIGHSWGGHLAIHVAAALPDRLLGVLAVDPLGAVGDGGEQEFEAAIFARTPADVRERAQEMDERALRGEGSEDDVIEGLRLVWPAYFPDWDTAPPMPEIRASAEAYSATFASLHEEMPGLEAALPGIRVPVGLLAGAASPMPVTASTDVADRIPGAWADVIDGAGHFPWMERPGCVRAALDRLIGG
jgi:pimeloyl-ACP methyl ester carboxylesterase